MRTQTAAGFLASEYAPAPAGSARFHVIPVPYEKTTSYGKGTARGPAAILAASQQLEAFNGRGCPGTQGIHTTKNVDCRGPAAVVVRRIERAVAAALRHGALPIVLGGEHTVTLGALHALRRAGIEFGIVQFDAHADLRATYEGSPYSHACVMRRAVELGIPVMQLGVRALCLEEHTFRRQRRIAHVDAAELAKRGVPRRLLPKNFPRAVYISFDVDGLDPSVMPATGTPVPGGLTWYQAQELMRRALAGRRLIGGDVVELAPRAGFHAADFATAQLVYDLIGLA